MAFCEIEPFAQKVLKKHWPNVPIYNDVKTLTYDRLQKDGIKTVDVIAGGFPCQDISLAGKDAGISEGTRSGLWSEYARLISDIRPRYAIIENVTNLLAGNNGAWFATVLSDLAKIGYDAEWHCMPAYYIGAPHIRDRVWIIAHANKSMYVNDTARLFYPHLSKSYLKRKIDSASALLLRHKRDDLQTDRRSLRNDDGFSGGVDRLGACGNAVIPQIVEMIGHAILAVEKMNNEK